MAKKDEKRGAHLRKENRNNPDYVSAGKKAYVPTGNPRGRKPTGHVAKPYVPKKPDGRKKVQDKRGAHFRKNMTPNRRKTKHLQGSSMCLFIK